MIKRLITFFLLFCGTVLFAQSTHPSLAFQQVTTHPDEDLSPKISPDGKWLAFASKRSGNFDIWIRPADGDGQARRITSHKANDLYPVWGSKSRRLFFVSQRSDAAGDIWSLKLRRIGNQLIVRGKPERLTTYLGYDGFPSPSPGGKYIAFTSDRSGQNEIWQIDIRNKKLRQLTFENATHPAWCPNRDKVLIAYTSFKDSSSHGDIRYLGIDPQGIRNLSITKGTAVEGFPSWSADGDTLVFLRHEFDTNGDGFVTPADKGQIYAVTLSPHAIKQPTNFQKFWQIDFNMEWLTAVRPLTMPMENIDQPFLGANHSIYFAQRYNKNIDIWQMREEHRFSADSSFFPTRNKIEAALPLPETQNRQHLGPLFLKTQPLSNEQKIQIWQRLQGYHRLFDNGDNIRYAAPILYEISVCYHLLGLGDKADQYMDFLLKNYATSTHQFLYARMLGMGINLAQTGDYITTIDSLTNFVNSNADKYEPAAAALIAMGDLYLEQGENNKAFEKYLKVQQKYKPEKGACAESQLKIGDVFAQFASQDEVVSAYLQVLEKYPQQRQWIVPARDRIFSLLTKDVTGTQLLISRYRDMIGQFSNYPLLTVAAQLKIANTLKNAKEYTAAIQEYELVESLYSQFKPEVFEAKLGRAQTLLEIGESLAAFNLMQELVVEYEKDYPALSQRALTTLITTNIKSGHELKRLGDYKLAIVRYRTVLKHQPDNLEAHRGYIECHYYLRDIDKAITEYTQRRALDPKNKTVLYALGLAYSYKGTEQVELYNGQEIDVASVEKSNKLVSAALEYDYTILPAYLTTSYNYELLENYELRQKNKPKKWYKKVYNTLSAPVISVYRMATFYNETKPPRYYERAIHQLSKAIALNDESANPTMEANLALNLANNYYNLGEFGYAKAYDYYHVKMRYDSSFVNDNQRAVIFERMGHCATVTEDLENGPVYLQKAAMLYQKFGDKQHVLLNLKRLALLYEIGEDSDFAIEYFQQAAELERQQKKYTDLMKSYRSLAYHYMLLDEPKEAIAYANRALDLLESGKVERSEEKPIYIKAGILGLYVPIPYDLRKFGAQAEINLTTDEEEALLYTIVGKSYSSVKDYDNAIEFLQKKIKIYEKNKDNNALAAFNNNIGFLYFLKGEFEQAWPYFTTSLDLCQKENNVNGILTNSSNLAKIVLGLYYDPNSNKENLQTYYNKAGKQINESLKLVDNDEYRSFRKTCQLYLLLSEMVLVNYSSLDKTDLTASIQSSFYIMENASFAETYLNEALRLAKQNEYTYEETQSYYRLGELYLAIGNFESAYRFLSIARRMALRIGFYDDLWRIDTLLGDVLRQMPLNMKRALSIQKVAFEFYAEAIDVLQAHPQQDKGSNAAIVRAAHQQPYKKAIKYLAEKGDYFGALSVAEQMREMYYLDLVGGEHIELRKERHKIYYGNAKFLQREINSLNINILQAKNQPEFDRTELRAMYRQLADYQDEYKTLLDNARQEVPELESFIRVNPVDITQVQDMLSTDQAVFYYNIVDNIVYTWIVDAFELKFESFPKSDFSLGTVKNVYENYKNVILIPDFADMGQSFDEELNAKTVTSSSLTSYYYAFFKRKILGDQYLRAGYRDSFDDIEALGYTVLNPVENNKDNAFLAQKNILNSADIIDINLYTRWNAINPQRSQLGFRVENSAPARFNSLDMYQLSLNASLIYFENAQALPDKGAGDILLALERAIEYAGVPTMLLALWPYENNQPFLTRFFEKLETKAAIDALYETKQEFKNAGRSFEEWGRYQLFGFGGMSEEEAIQYARDGFEIRVRKGHSAFQMQEWADAIKYYDQALKMAEKQDDEKSIGLLQQQILQSAVSGQLWDKAIDVQQKMIAAANEAEDVSAVANGMNNLAYFMVQKKEYNKGVAYKEKFADIANSYGLQKERASAFREMGLIYERGGDYDLAIDFFEQAYDIYWTNDDKAGMANCLRDQGRINLLYRDNYLTALEFQQKALELLQPLGLSADFVDLVQNLGLSYEKLANYSTALQYQLKGLELANELGDARFIGLANQYAANVYWKSGDFINAMEHQEKALAIFQQLGDQSLLKIGLSTKGLISYSLGDIEKALDFENQALTIAQNIDDQKDQATIHKNIGMIYRADGKTDFALDHFNSAVKIDSTIDYKRGLAYDYRNLASINIDLNNIELADTLVQKSLQLSREIDDKRNEIQSLYHLGQILHAQKDDAASDTLLTVIQLADQYLLSDIKWRALQELAKIYIQDKNEQAAIDTYYQAINVIESVRSKIQAEELASGFITNKLDVYDELIQLLVKNYKVAEAFDVVERSKSRSFLDLLENRALEFGDENETIVTQIDQLSASISKLQQAIFYANQNDSLMALTMKQQLDSTNVAKAQLMDSLRVTNPELAQLVDVKPWQLADVQQILPDSVAVVEYYISDEKLFIWAFSNTQSTVHTVTVTREELNDQIVSLRKALERQLSVENYAEFLYKQLFALVHRFLSKNSHVILVPHGSLHYVPFGILKAKDQEPLAFQHTLSITPSSTILGLSMQKGQAVNQLADQLAVTAFGNPDLGDPALALPFADKEVHSLERYYSNVQPFLNQNATEANLVENEFTAPFLLFSCHGEYDAANPLASALLLTGDDYYDGRLQADEIFDLNLNSQMLVMSACETGLATIRGGDEVVGLNRSFLFAGAASIMSSLWKVDDLATAVLTKRFFRYLSEGYPRSQALQMAQKVVYDEIDPYPAFWGAFQITGDFR